MTFVDDLGSTKGKAANQRYQNTVKKAGTQQNKNVQSFSNIYADSPYLQTIPPAQLFALAQATIRSSINPYLKQLNQQFLTQQRTGIADIRQANAGFVKSAGQYTGQVGAADEEAIHGQQLLDAGINQYLSEAGKNVTSGVANQLQAAGAPQAALDATQQQVGGLATGIGGEQLGLGASTLSRMMSQKAADVNYGNLLPNVARAMGQQDTTLFTRNVAQQRAQAIGDVTAKVPGLVNDVYMNLRNAEVQKAELNRAYGLDEAKLTSGTGGTAHYQLKHQVNKDGSTTYFSYDPATGGAVPGSEWTVPGQPGGPGSAKHGPADPSYKSALKTGQDLHKNLMKTLNGYIIKDPVGKIIAKYDGIPDTNKAARTNAIIQARSNAVAQVVAAIQAGHPNWNDQQVGKAAALVLQQSGFLVGANIASGRTTQQAADAATRAAAGLAPKGGGGKKTTPHLQGPVGNPSVPGVPGVEGPTPQPPQNATQNAQTQQSVVTVATKDVEERVKEYPTATSEQRMIAYVHDKYPSIPAQKVREIVRAVLAKYTT